MENQPVRMNEASTVAEPTPVVVINSTAGGSERQDSAAPQSANAQPSSATSTSSDFVLKNLVKKMEQLERQITKLDEEECNLESMDTEESVYMLQDRLKRELLFAWQRYSKLVGQSPRIPPERPRKFVLETSVKLHHSHINHRLQRYAAGVEFPSREDMLRLMKKCVRHYKVEWSEALQKQYVDDAFQALGAQAQAYRQKHFWNDHGCQLTDVVVSHIRKRKKKSGTDAGAGTGGSDVQEDGGADLHLDDPALHDKELEAKLKRNQQEGTAKLDKLLEDFGEASERSDSGESSGSDNNDGGSNSDGSAAVEERDYTQDDDDDADLLREDDEDGGVGSTADGGSDAGDLALHSDGDIKESRADVDENGDAKNAGEASGPVPVEGFPVADSGNMTARTGEDEYEALYGDASDCDDDDDVVPTIFDDDDEDEEDNNSIGHNADEKVQWPSGSSVFATTAGDLNPDRSGAVLVTMPYPTVLSTAAAHQPLATAEHQHPIVQQTPVPGSSGGPTVASMPGDAASAGIITTGIKRGHDSSGEDAPAVKKPAVSPFKPSTTPQPKQEDVIYIDSD
ncbi:uncharacterized protein LOC135822962 [Sycon ciliatum]|uniref:uncharacterized protein LOC135822962 n=1 Tax=Sycon ciliatum TaxID=27933 RepID=UPI0020AEAEC1|eukprot:scpid47543/ scgid17765/ 